jgi:hypothetical protein
LKAAILPGLDQWPDPEVIGRPPDSQKAGSRFLRVLLRGELALEVGGIAAGNQKVTAAHIALPGLPDAAAIGAEQVQDQIRKPFLEADQKNSSRRRRRSSGGCHHHLRS